MAESACGETNLMSDDHPEDDPRWWAVFCMYDFRDAAGAFVQVVRRYVPTTVSDPGETAILMPGFPQRIAVDEVRKPVWDLGFEISYTAETGEWSDLSREAYVGFQWTAGLFNILVQRWKEPGTEFDFARGRLPKLVFQNLEITPQELDALTRAFEMVDRAIPEMEQKAIRITGMDPAWLYRAMRKPPDPARQFTPRLSPGGGETNTAGEGSSSNGEGSSSNASKPRNKSAFGKGAGKLNLESAARAVFLEHHAECWTIRQIAESLGCHPKSLTRKRCPQLHEDMAYAKAVHKADRARPRGGKDVDTGDVEAWG